MKKTISTIALLAMATTANAFDVQTDIGFTQGDGSAPFIGVTAKKHLQSPFFIETGFILAGDEDERNITHGQIQQTKLTSRNQVTDETHTFSHNGIFAGLGWQVKGNDLFFNLSVGGILTQTDEETSGVTTDTLNERDPNDLTKFTTTVTTTGYSHSWSTEYVSPYLAASIEQPINTRSSFLVTAKVYKTELHDILATSIGLSFNF